MPRMLVNRQELRFGVRENFEFSWFQSLFEFTFDTDLMLRISNLSYRER